MFSTVLIANRGAIACRILRTLKQLHVRAVAVYSEADAASLHVGQADEAVCLGGGPAAENYLNAAKLIAAAQATGAQAVHPGYGFLSESAEFAEACAAAGLVFIGPTPEQLRVFGLKHSARTQARAQGLPLLPGSGLVDTAEAAGGEAARLGYPVMLKSTAGGGGIGMGVCADEATLRATFASVRGLAAQAFTPGGVFLEKFVPLARHIEVQIFGDGRGRVVALGERDCSVQRRRQKVIEETPAPGLPEEVRGAMHAAAVRLVSATGYQSAGTVEFLYAPETAQFYFLEVNPRLQVEHGVTEEVTGVDLVAWMVRQAAGELDLSAWQPRPPQGVALQARLYAEDPHKGFQPSAGLLTEVLFPGDARVETWVERGTDVPSLYDPLLAKVIVKADTRPAALARLQAALAATRLAGIETNLDYLRQVVASEAFGRAAVHTRWLEGLACTAATIDVLEPGTQSSIQDYPGRVGYWAIGVPPSGPMDDLAFRLANRLVGNVSSAAGLELTLAGPTLKFNLATTIALTGATMAGELDGERVRFWECVTVRVGSVLRLRGITGGGCRSYLAVAGGFDVPDYLGSKATFSLGKFGGHAGRVLRAGDVLHVGATPPAPTCPDAPDAPTARSGEPARVPASLVPVYGRRWTIGVLYGPHAAPDFFAEEFIDEFFRTDWKVHYNSNRLGIRLLGPRPVWTRPDGGEAGLHPSNIHDNEYAVGTINFTGDMPVILAKDGPSLGGFVCPATIVKAELWKVGQLRPGDTIRFARTTFAEALAAEGRQDAAIETLAGEALPAPAFLPKSFDAAAGDGAVLHRIEAAADTAGEGRPGVVYRQAGDKYLLIEYGPPRLDLELRFRVHALMGWFAAHPLEGVLELSPGVRSLQVHFDSRRLPLSRLLDTLILAETELPSAESMEVPTRVLHLPLAFEASSTRQAIDKYRQSVRATAPWLPSNVDFIRRINGLASVDDVRATMFKASYLVLGLGDVYLGAPCAVPIDPRHRLTTTKYNPARTWTAEGEVGIGGVYLCVYGMESPGGYQLVGRTVPVWNTYKRTAEFAAGSPWLLRFFDQVRFFPMAEAELLAFRQAFLRGQARLEITEEVFSVRAHRAFLAREADDIAAFRTRQQQAFDAERERWASQEADPLGASEGGHDERLGPRPDEEGALPAGALQVGSPINGSVWALLVKPGERVVAGQRVAVIEAMKMEVSVETPVGGLVVSLLVAPGRLVTGGQGLLVVAPEAPGEAPPARDAAGGAGAPEVPASLDLGALAAAYDAGLRPTTLIDAVYARIAARGDDHVWIHRVPAAEARAAAERVAARRAAGEVLPLYGVPFAVKDNIDVAGRPTTAACPEFEYTASATAPAVQRLLEAGALLIGKTNLDQFATGLVGVRSPYGAPSSVFHPDYIAGGSSAGSAVAVAAGLVGFSLGTDTAGSGRIPAAFNNLVGWKPTRGLLSTRGVVPACRSLDCISVFTLTCADAQSVAGVIAGYDEADPYSRDAGPGVERWAVAAAFRFGVPPAAQLEFFGDTAAAALFGEAVARLEALGGERVEVDFAPFREAAELLYAGPWVAERLAAIQPFLEEHPGALHPVTARIIGGGARYSAVDTFQSFYRLEELRRETEPVWKTMDVLLLPTAGTHYTLAQLEADPIQLNTNLGLYTNFVNLLDLCAVAVPSGFRANGLPFGVTLVAPAFHDDAVCTLAGRYQRAVGGRLGGTAGTVEGLVARAGLARSSGAPGPRADATAAWAGEKGRVELAVAGAHLSGQPLNGRLTGRGATLVRTTRTAAGYRLFALAGTVPPKPGLVRAPGFAGPGIEVEVWSLDEAALGSLLAEVPAPLAIGTVQLIEGGPVKGFVCEPAALAGAAEITAWGGWRAYLGSQSAREGPAKADVPPVSNDRLPAGCPLV